MATKITFETHENDETQKIVYNAPIRPRELSTAFPRQ